MVTINGTIVLEDGSFKNLFTKSILIHGRAIHGSTNLQIQSGGSVTVAPNALYNLSPAVGPGQVFVFSGSFTNNGTLRRSIGGGHDFSLITATINDSLLVEQGKVKLTSGVGLNNAVAVIDASATLEIKEATSTNTEFVGQGELLISGPFDVESGTTIDVPVRIIDGVFDNKIELTLNEKFTLSQTSNLVTGTYRGSSSSKLILNNQFFWEGPSSISGNGTIECKDSVFLSGATKDLSLANNFALQFEDVCLWEEGSILTGSNVEIINMGEWFWKENSNLAFSQLFTPTPASIHNLGDIIKEGMDTISIGLPLIQNDGVIIGLGTLLFNNDNMVISGQGFINPGLSPGTLTLDSNVLFSSGLEFEVDENTGQGIGYDYLLIDDHIDISAAKCKISGLLNIPDGRYIIMQCQNGPGCYTGTFDTTFIGTDLRLDFLPDRIELVKGPGCLNTWKVDGLLLGNDPHAQVFSASNLIISNGVITSTEEITFEATNGSELLAGFEVEGNAAFSVTLDGCPE